jgi:hypothetical protein
MRRSRGYRQAVEAIIGRPLLRRDGESDARLRRAERRLHLALPGAVREYYRLAGAATENREHNRLYRPSELVIEDEYLVFMEENQSVVHWGFPLPLERGADPEVWQRTNGDTPEWSSEEMPFSLFIIENLAWQRGIELSNNGLQLTKPPGRMKRLRS